MSDLELLDNLKATWGIKVLDQVDGPSYSPQGTTRAQLWRAVL